MVLFIATDGNGARSGMLNDNNTLSIKKTHTFHVITKKLH